MVFEAIGPLGSYGQAARQYGTRAQTLHRIVSERMARGAKLHPDTKAALVKMLGPGAVDLLRDDDDPIAAPPAATAPANHGAGGEAPAVECQSVMVINAELKREVQDLRETNAQLIAAMKLLAQFKEERDRAIAAIGGPAVGPAIPSVPGTMTPGANSNRSATKRTNKRKAG